MIHWNGVSFHSAVTFPFPGLNSSSVTTRNPQRTQYNLYMPSTTPSITSTTPAQLSCQQCRNEEKDDGRGKKWFCELVPGRENRQHSTATCTIVSRYEQHHPTGGEVSHLPHWHARSPTPPSPISIPIVRHAIIETVAVVCLLPSTQLDATWKHHTNPPSLADAPASLTRAQQSCPRTSTSPAG